MSYDCLLNVLIQILLCTNVAIASFSIPILENATTISSSSDAIVTIINLFYQCTSISVSRGADRNHQIQSDFIDATLDRLNTYSVLIDDSAVLRAVLRRQNTLIFVDDYDEFRHVFEKIQRGNYKLTGYYMFVLTKANQQRKQLFDMTAKILESCWSMYIVNVVVVWPTLSIEIDHTDIYSYFPYSPEHCERVRPVLMDQFRSGNFSQKRHLFPSKLNNMYMCPLTVASVMLYPYSTQEVTPSNASISSDPATFSGLDVLVVNELARHLNFSYSILIPSDPIDRGVRLKNNTITGIFGMVTKCVFRLKIKI